MHRSETASSPAMVVDWGLLRFFPVLFLNYPIFPERTGLVALGLCWCSFQILSQVDACWNCLRCLSFLVHWNGVSHVSQKHIAHTRHKKRFRLWFWATKFLWTKQSRKEQNVHWGLTWTLESYCRHAWGSQLLGQSSWSLIGSFALCQLLQQWKVMRSLLLCIWPFVEVFPCPVAHEPLLLELILCCRVTLESPACCPRLFVVFFWRKNFSWEHAEFHLVWVLLN